MGDRRDKSNAVARYLTTNTGVPGWRFNGTGMLDAPAPFYCTLTTSGILEKWTENIRELPHTGIPLTIRYDRHLDHVGEAWVTMRLSDLAPILGAYWNHHHNGRGK